MRDASREPAELVPHPAVRRGARLGVDSLEALQRALGEFRFFYNHVRPHQHLGGATPAEAWAGVDPFRTKVKEERWFESWDGLLRGYHLRR